MSRSVIEPGGGGQEAVCWLTFCKYINKPIMFLWGNNNILIIIIMIIAEDNDGKGDDRFISTKERLV